jgi:hypothetical protein
MTETIFEKNGSMHLWKGASARTAKNLSGQQRRIVQTEAISYQRRTGAVRRPASAFGVAGDSSAPFATQDLKNPLASEAYLVLISDWFE